MCRLWPRLDLWRVRADRYGHWTRIVLCEHRKLRLLRKCDCGTSLRAVLISAGQRSCIQKHEAHWEYMSFSCRGPSLVSSQHHNALALPTPRSPQSSQPQLSLKQILQCSSMSNHSSTIEWSCGGLCVGGPRIARLLYHFNLCEVRDVSKVIIYESTQKKKESSVDVEDWYKWGGRSENGEHSLVQLRMR